MPDFTVEPEDVLKSKLQDLIGGKFLQKTGGTEREKEESNYTETATIEHLKDTKYVGLFFSAEWCPPCKHMLQPLKNFYTDLNLQERTFEIILISSDHSEDEWRRHHNSMPWMSLPWRDARADELRSKFEILGVPALIILDAQTGFTITEKARKDLGKEVSEVKESWDKLLELKKVSAVERAQLDAIAKAQKAERDWKEKQKKEADKLAAEGAA